MLHLPVIVESAESSPDAAREAANRIRKFLSRDNYQRAYVQYNAIMLIRILADHPGESFTRNLDAKFASTVKDLLRDGRDMSVQQILRETLDSFETSKSNDETLAPLRDMWKKEKAKWSKGRNPVSITTSTITTESRSSDLVLFNQPTMRSQNYINSGAVQPDPRYSTRSHHRPRGLPPPHELAQRVEEARTSSKLLLQVVQSTPPHEVLTNDLIKEFVDRCQSASRSVQSYINSEDPRPDEDTLLTLIETNDQISTALSRYQRAMLQARRMTGSSPSPGPNGLQRNGTGGAAEMPVSNQPNDVGPYSPPANGLFSAPSGPPPQRIQRKDLPPQPSHFQAQSQPHSSTDENPFDDPKHETMHAPSEFGLPPSQIDNSDSAAYRSTVSGYHSGYEPPTSPRREVGVQVKSGRRTETHVDDSDEEEEWHPRGQERGQAVQYRF